MALLERSQCVSRSTATPRLLRYFDEHSLVGVLRESNRRRVRSQSLDGVRERDVGGLAAGQRLMPPISSAPATTSSAIPS
jgi:hypothetical protein